MPDTEITTVLMIRHADVHNPSNIVYGRLPRFRLSEIGRSQIAQLTEKVGGLEVAAIYSSPQLRARQTAAVLAARLGCDTVRRSSLIAEVLTGYQGQSNSILGSNLNFYDKPANPDDESIPMVARRMAQFLDLARRRHPGGIVIGVSHADPIMILRATTLGLPLVIRSIQGKYYPAKCSITQFSFVGEERRPIVTYRELVKDETIASTRPTKKAEPAAPSENGHKPTPWLPKTAGS